MLCPTLSPLCLLSILISSILNTVTSSSFSLISLSSVASMTPVSLNPPASPSFPLTDKKDDQLNQLFISPNNQDSASLSCRSFFNIIDQRKTRHNQEDDKLALHGGSSNHRVWNSTSLISPQAAAMEDPSNACGKDLSFYKMEEDERKSAHESSRWMSSKMRLMRKMMSPNDLATDDKASNNNTPTFQSQQRENNQRSPSSSCPRVCSDCNTTSTPLWRSGPKGPKSLCNACGIRQRKARRAMAEAAAAGSVSCMDACSATKTRGHNKEKKSRTNYFAQPKNKCKPTAAAASTSQGGIRKLGFKDFALSLRNNNSAVFPQDEVAEAALLLMDLSCGFVHF